MLDADAEGANWREVPRIVFHVESARDPERARRTFESHLALTKWLSRHNRGNCSVTVGPVSNR